MVLALKVLAETCFSVDSTVQSAVMSPVMTSMDRPLPGRSTRWPRVMTADSWVAFAQTSWDCSGVRTMPVVVRLTLILVLE